MAPIVAWKRLVRYISQDGNEKFGEPIVASDEEDITTTFDAGTLEVYVCEGNDPITA